MKGRDDRQASRGERTQKFDVKVEMPSSCDENPEVGESGKHQGPKERYGSQPQRGPDHWRTQRLYRGDAPGKRFDKLISGVGHECQRPLNSARRVRNARWMLTLIAPTDWPLAVAASATERPRILTNPIASRCFLGRFSNTRYSHSRLSRNSVSVLGAW